MHIGDVDGEKGIEIVTVGVERQGPEGDPTWLAGGLQVWRASGSTFTSIDQLCVIFTRTYRMGTTWYGYVVKKTAHFLTTMDSVYADVLAGSSKKLLLITGSQRFRLSQGNSGGGYLMAMEAGKNYEQGTSGKRARDIFPRFVNFAFESPTGVCGFTYPNGVMTADVNNDTKREIVTSGYNVVGSTGSFVACWR